MAVREGYGSTLTAGTSAWTASIISMDWSGITREAIDTTHLGSTDAESFIPSELYNPGSLSVTVRYDPRTPPPYDGAAETWTLTFPGTGTGATYAASGFIEDFTIGTVENKNTVNATISIKMTGAITKTNL